MAVEVESHDFSQAEKERTVCKAEQIHRAASIFREHPFKTSARFRGGGVSPLPTFADARGVGVSGMPTSAIFISRQIPISSATICRWIYLSTL